MAGTTHVFSVRNRASTHNQGLGLLLTEELREQIWAVLDQFNFAFDVNRGGTAEDGAEIEVTDVLTQVGEDLEQLYESEAPGPRRPGTQRRSAVPSHRRPSSGSRSSTGS